MCSTRIEFVPELLLGKGPWGWEDKQGFHGKQDVVSQMRALQKQPGLMEVSVLPLTLSQKGGKIQVPLSPLPLLHYEHRYNRHKSDRPCEKLNEHVYLLNLRNDHNWRQLIFSGFQI